MAPRANAASPREHSKPDDVAHLEIHVWYDEIITDDELAEIVKCREQGRVAVAEFTILKSVKRSVL